MPTSAQAAETCQGKPVTITDPGGDLVGTEGDDVVVTGLAVRVRTLGGDDTVCVTNPQGLVEVDAGTGNDSVVVQPGTSGAAGVVGDLGPGADNFVGGLRTDTVNDGHDTDADAINTGGGQDHVTSGVRGSVNPDSVDTGSGLGDTVELTGTSFPGGIRGGNDDDRLVFSDRTPSAWAFDTDTGIVTRNGAVAGTITGFSDHYMFDLVGSVRFSGSSAAEHLSIASFASPGSGAVLSGNAVDMRGGDDSVSLSSGSGAEALVGGGRYVGGSGKDQITATTFGWLSIDLAGRRVDTGPARTTVRGAAEATVNFESARAEADQVELTGDSRANTLGYGGCDVRVRGRGRDDKIERAAFPESTLRCDRPLHTALRGEGGNDRIEARDEGTNNLFGGPGDDRLTGNVRKDRLIGGAGRDKARGRAGRDTCRAEKTISCER